MSPYSNVINLQILLLLSLAISGDVEGMQGSSIHRLLPKFGLPIGLFPNNVKSFNMDGHNTFEMKLRSSCTVEFEYPLLYDSSIKGTLRYGSIVELEGIQMQRFNRWFEINRIRVDLPPTNNIYFHIVFMLFETGLDVDQFNTVRSCNGNVGFPLSFKRLSVANSSSVGKIVAVNADANRN